jgi:hypothetical protein
VRFCSSPHGPWTEAETRNIGIGGAFIASPTVPAIGSALMVEVRLPMTDQRFTLPAIVRWARPNVGMGVEFVGADVDVLLELNDYFATLTGA